MEKELRKCLYKVLTAFGISIGSVASVGYYYIDELKAYIAREVKPIVIEEIVYPKVRKEIPDYVLNDKEVLMLVNGELKKSYIEAKIKKRITRQIELIETEVMKKAQKELEKIKEELKVKYEEQLKAKVKQIKDDFLQKQKEDFTNKLLKFR